MYISLSKILPVMGIIDKLNEWNEELNNFSAEHLDNVFVGTVIIGVLIVIAFWGVQTLNKK